MTDDTVLPYDVPLDHVELKIVRLLSADARLSVRALAREIGMSPSAISERVSRLEHTGVIRGYHADVDPAALGFHMQVMVGLQTEQGPTVSDTIKSLLAIPEVVSVNVVTGNWDLIVVAQVRDHHHLRDVVLQQLWSIVGFRHSETMLVLDRHSSARWPSPTQPGTRQA